MPLQELQIRLRALELSVELEGAGARADGSFRHDRVINGAIAFEHFLKTGENLEEGAS